MTSLGAVDTWRAPAEGVRRFDAPRDLRAVIELLEIGFGADLEARDRRWLADLQALSGTGPLLGWFLHLVPPANNVFNGFVWCQDGQVVANCSLMRATRRVWVIANVVTHPDWRRRGISRQLVLAAIDSARNHGGRQIQLQVRDDNVAAQTMYRQMGFRHLWCVTSLRLPSAREARASGQAPQGWQLKPWPRVAPEDVTRVLTMAGEPEGPAPGVLRQSVNQRGLRGRLTDGLQGITRHRLAAVADGQTWAVGVGVAQAFGGPHALEIMVDPSRRGQVEAALADELLARLGHHGAYEVAAEVRGDETGVLAALQAAGFTPVRTLERLTLDL